MDASRLRELRSKDKVAWGIHLSFFCPETIEVCGLLGFEWLLLDAEHMPLHHHLCRDLARAADLAGLPCVVRVPEIRAAVIEGFLDAGVVGILAPNVSSVAAARALVAAVKFSPEGQRGAAARSRAANYGLTQTPAEFARQANELTFTAALIETQSGLDQLESITAVPGLDYIGVGASDLALSLGCDEGMRDPDFRAIVENAQARIKACRKPQLAVVSDADQGKKAAAAGATLVAVPDALLFATAGRSFLQQVK